MPTDATLPPPAEMVATYAGALRWTQRGAHRPRTDLQVSNRFGRTVRCGVSDMTTRPLAASLRRGRSGVVGVFVGERLLYAFRDPVAERCVSTMTI